MFSGPGRLVASVLLGGFVLAGCQPVLPSPSPVPTWRCTPEAGGEEFDCSQRQYDEMVAKDKLYAEAEAVYRRFFEENARLFRLGGIAEPTAVLQATAAGDYLDDSMEQYRSMLSSGQKVAGGEIRLAWIRRTPGQAMKGSVLSIEACIDMSSADVVDSGGSSESGIVGIEQLFFGRFDGSLKIQNSAWEEIKSC